MFIVKLRDILCNINESQNLKQKLFTKKKKIFMMKF